MKTAFTKTVILCLIALSFFTTSAFCQHGDAPVDTGVWMEVEIIQARIGILDLNVQGCNQYQLSIQPKTGGSAVVTQLVEACDLQLNIPTSQWPKGEYLAIIQALNSGKTITQVIKITD